MRMGVFSYWGYSNPSENNSPLIYKDLDRAIELLGFFIFIRGQEPFKVGFYPSEFEEKG